MGFLNSIKSMFGGDGGNDGGDLWIHVRCRRCGEVIKTRVDLRNALNPRDDEAGYMMRKTLVGNQLCFQRIEVTLYFDEHRRLVDQEIEHGEFVSPDP